MAFLVLDNVTGQPLPSRQDSAAARLDAVRTLLATMTKKADQQQDDAARLDLYRTASADLLEICPTNLAVQETVNRAVARAKETPDRKQAVQLLRTALREAQDTLAFKHVIEAPLPEGFPEPTPVGEIQLRQYPAYRLARTEMAGAGTSAFFTLFTHIKKKDIEMTAPVELTYTPEDTDSLQARTMAFLYRSTRQGEIGKDEKVEVVEIPAMMALSFGLRGDVSRARLAAAKAHLDAWLEDHAEEYEASGLLRVMGYNSPFVAADRRFTEVQIPVRARKPAR
jgi:hypothetical protein